MKKSQYNIGDRLVVTNTYHGFTKTETVAVVDPEKKKVKNEYCIYVRKSDGREGWIPTKYVTRE